MIKKIIVRLNLLKIISLVLYIFRIFPIKKNKVCFINFSGKGYGDNPKYITEEILKENEDIEIVWFVKNIEKVKKEFPSRVRLVKIFSLRYLYELATAKVWVNNSRFDQFVIKRKGQYYIQTWHGGLALKKIEYDAADKMSEYYHKVMKNDNNLMDVMISNSKFCTEVYRRAFRFKGDIKEYGTPRNDFLLQKHDDTITKIRNFFDIKEDNKILLYAPTFRDKYLKNP